MTTTERSTAMRLRPGEPAPNPLVSLEGHALRLGDYRKGEALVLIFLRHLM